MEISEWIKQHEIKLSKEEHQAIYNRMRGSAIKIYNHLEPIYEKSGMWWFLASVIPEDPDIKPVKCFFCHKDILSDQIWANALRQKLCCSKECLLKNIDPVKGG